MKRKFKDINELLGVSLKADGTPGTIGKTRLLSALPTTVPTPSDQKVLQEASLWFDNRTKTVDNVPTPTGRPVLGDERYVYKDFRALSQILLQNRGLDFSTPGVLQKAVGMLAGKTVYPNHDFSDINNWVGVVSEAKWDSAGAETDGVAGINCQIKVDAFLNYRIACGLMMQPPAINAMSLTILFEFEYSHPAIAAESPWKFYELLGEEVDGEIVRMIVTKVVEIWEASLVFMGEDRLAKGVGGNGQLSADEEEIKFAGGDPASLGANDDKVEPPNSNEEKTMRLAKEKRTELGIEFDGDDVPETEILKAAEAQKARADQLAQSTEVKTVEELKAKAELADTLLEDKRAEVTRLATLAECGGDEKKQLPEVVADDIKGADVTRLQKLEKHYQAKAAEKFPAGGRSSLENGDDVDRAGGTGDEDKKDELPDVEVL